MVAQNDTNNLELSLVPYTPNLSSHHLPSTTQTLGFPVSVGDVLYNMIPDDIISPKTTSDFNTISGDDIQSNTSKPPSQYKQFQILQNHAISNSDGKRVTRSKITPVMLEKSPKHLETLETSSSKKDFFEVDTILGRRINKDKNLVEYLIKWKHYSSEWNSWVLVSDLHCKDVIDEFEAKKDSTDDSLLLVLQSTGFFAPNTLNIVRYLDSNYFIVPYGIGQINHYCIVGPDRSKISMKCKNTNGLLQQHMIHAKLVTQAVTNGNFESLCLSNLLPNKDKNKHLLSAELTLPNNGDTSKFSLSRKSFSFNLDDALKMKLNAYASNGKLPHKLTPNEQPPPKCKCESSKPNFYLQEPIYHSSKLYTLAGIKNVQVGTWKCINNDQKCTLYYDGQCDAIFNYTNTISVAYDVFFDFIFCLISSKSMAFDGFVKKMNYMYHLIYGQVENFMSKKTWIDCFLSWMNLLQIDNTIAFHCVICGDYPSWLGFDGVSLGLAKKNILWNTVDQIPNFRAPKKTNSSSNSNKALIKSADCRKLLRNFISGDINDKGTWETLISSLKENCLPLFDLLEDLYKKQLVEFGLKSVSYTFAGIWSSVLKICAASNGISFFMSPPVVCVINNYLKFGKLSVLQEHQLGLLCPILHSLIKSLPNQNLSQPGKDLLQLLADTSYQVAPSIYSVDKLSLLNSNEKVAMIEKKGLNKCDIQLGNTIPEKHSTETRSTWAYNWPKLREMPVYVGLDKERESSIPDFHKPNLQWNDNEQSSVIMDEDCTKKEDKTYTMKNLIPGLFVGCCPHRICYGYHLMLEPKGRKDLMKVLYERMPQEILNQLTVVYDFSCQGAVYCVKRKPQMFAQTKFLVDRFHAYSHKCSDFWKLQAYPGFSEMVSTASESFNSELQPLQNMTAYMKQETFMKFLTLFISIKNSFKNKTLLTGKEQLQIR